MQDRWSLTCCLSWTLGNLRNITTLSHFYRYYFGRCSSDLAELVPPPYSWERSTFYSDRLHDFSITIPRCHSDDYVNSSFPGTDRLWNVLPIECLPLTYDLNSFKSRINRYLLTVDFSKYISWMLQSFSASFFVIPCLVMAVECIPIKKNYS